MPKKAISPPSFIFVQLEVKLVMDCNHSKPALFVTQPLWPVGLHQLVASRDANIKNTPTNANKKSIFSSRYEMSDSRVKGAAECSCSQEQSLLARLAIAIFL